MSTKNVEMSPAQCRAGRALLDMTQSRLGELAQLGLSTVVDFEKGRRQVSPAAVEKFEAHCSSRVSNSPKKTVAAPECACANGCKSASNRPLKHLATALAALDPAGRNPPGKSRDNRVQLRERPESGLRTRRPFVAVHKLKQVADEHRAVK